MKRNRFRLLSTVDTHILAVVLWAFLLLLPTLSMGGTHTQNRLIGYTSPTTEASYAYDALDRRIAKTVDGVVTAYVYDMSPDDPLAYDDITLEFTDGILTRRWSHSDAVDEPLGFEAYANQSGVGSGAEHAIYADRQGSVIWVTDPATGAVVAGYEYDAYGRIKQTTGTLAQPYGYTGREYDAESGLYHYRARTYDPASGVFLQVDPIELIAGLNTYRYGSSSPLRWIDPLGLSETSAATFRSGLSIHQTGSAVEAVHTGLMGLVGQILNAIRTITLHARPGDMAKVVRVASAFPPPGDCTPKQQEEMQGQIDELKGMPKCNASMPWMELQKLQHYYDKRARLWAQINAIRFRGGDEGHRIAQENDSQAAANCGQAMADKARKW